MWNAAIICLIYTPVCLDYNINMSGDPNKQTENSSLFALTSFLLYCTAVTQKIAVVAELHFAMDSYHIPMIALPQ